jgi:hypothetical protein
MRGSLLVGALYIADLILLGGRILGALIEAAREDIDAGDPVNISKC